MDSTQLVKRLTVGAIAILAFIFTAAAAFASPYSGYQGPYGQVDTIGTYYQYTNQFSMPMYASQTYAYDYIAPPRAGGFFGWGTEYLVGLRSPMWTPVPPVHYTHYYQPVCGWPCWMGGYGYPRSTASQFPHYRTRLGGAFSY